MNLKPLEVEKYKEFATAKFEERNKHLDAAIIGELFARFGGVTSYIQRVMNVLFLKTPEQGTCTLDMVDDAINYNLNMASDTYETLHARCRKSSAMSSLQSLQRAKPEA